MNKELNTIKLEIEDPAFGLMRSTFNSGLSALVKRMLQTRGDGASLTLKVVLSHHDRQIDDSTETVDIVDIDYKIATSITEKASINGTLNTAGKWFVRLRGHGEPPVLQKLPEVNGQISLDEYMDIEEEEEEWEDE